MTNDGIVRITNADGLIEIRDPKIDLKAIMNEIRRRAALRSTYDDTHVSFTMEPTLGDGRSEAPNLPGKLVEQVALANRFHEGPKRARLPTGSRLGIAGRVWASLVRRLSSRTNAHVREATDLQVAFNRHVGRALTEIRDHLDAREARDAQIARAISGLQEQLTTREVQNHHSTRTRPNGAPELPSLTESLPDWGILDHQNTFRGTIKQVTAMQLRYLDCFSTARRVLDAGCGRGEFLLALRNAGVGAYGVDASHDMVDLCAKHNLEVYRADILTHLRSLPDKSLDGVFAAQVIEHLTFDELMEFLTEAYRALRVGGTLVCETPNPLSMVTGTVNFLLDPTHQRPIHPSLLQFMCQRLGYTDVELRFSSPHDRQLEQLPADGTGLDASTLEVLNANVARLNELLFGDQDYAVVATR
jgi:SAM-dependent methyltransferase